MLWSYRMKTKALIFLSVAIILLVNLLVAQSGTGRGGAGVEIDNKLAIWYGVEVIQSPTGQVDVTPPSAIGNVVTGVYVMRDGHEVPYHGYQIDGDASPIVITFVPPLEEGEILILHGANPNVGGGGVAEITPSN